MRWPKRTVGAGVLLALAGCMTVEQMAPFVGPAFSTPTISGEPLAVLERGRELYVTDCTRCHSPEPVNRYTVTHWNDIIRRMAPESKLNESDTSALRAYVLAAHRVMSQPSGGG